MKLTIHQNETDRLFFTADHHFGHTNIIKHTNRPFADVHTMNRELTDRWNAVVPPNGIVVHLGDFCWRHDPSNYFQHLNGKIILVVGNHDHKIGKFRLACSMLDLTVQRSRIAEPPTKIHMVCCHYCMRTWNRSHYNSWHLYGHSHGKLAPVGKSWDVGVDNNGYAPLSMADLEVIMARRPNNINYVAKSYNDKVWQQKHPELTL